MGWFDGDVTPVPLPAEIFGNVELIPGVPVASGGSVLLEGIPIGSKLDQHGGFILTNVPAGHWALEVEVSIPEINQTLSKTHVIGANAGAYSRVSDIVMTVALTAAGAVAGIDESNYSQFFVEVAAVGIAATVSPTGTFLLHGLPPGRNHFAVRSILPLPLAPQGKATNPGSEQDVDVYPATTTLVRGLVAPTNDPLTPPIGPGNGSMLDTPGP